MGGMVAMRLAINYPELIKSIILIDTSSEPEPAEHNGRNQLMAWVARYLGLGLIANKVMSMFFAKPFLSDPERRHLKKQWKNYFLANDRIGVSNAVKGVLWREGITDSLKKINTASIILVGENDMLTNMEKAEIMQKGINNSVLKVIPRAGHMSPVEEPVFVNGAITEFLGNMKK
jgi:pimeloyl-ACP methyl ester carboxylesterase